MIETIAGLFGKKWVEAVTQRLSAIKDSRRVEIEIIGDTFEDPVLLSRTYIEPDCQTLNPADEDEDSINIVVKSPALKQIAAFIDQSVPALNDGRNQLMLLADAGMGKTSLLVMLKMTHLTSLWPKKYDCVLIKLDKNSLSDIRQISGKANTVLLLDALDEDPTAWGDVKSRLLEILAASKGFGRVIITCRTQFFPEDEGDPFFRHSQGKIKVGPFVCPMIFLSLFDDEQVHKYIKKRFSHEDIETISKRTSYAETILMKMGSLRFRPLLLAYIDDFYDSDQDSWEESDIYRALLIAWLNREQLKLEDSGRRSSAEELMKTCVHLARLMHESGTRFLSEDDIKSHVRINPELNQIHYLDVGGRSLLNRNSNGDFRFSHFSIQEYLVSMGIIQGMFCSEVDSIQYTKKMLEFVVNRDTTNTSRKDVNLDPVKFSRNNISGIDFSGIYFKGKDFSNCTLRKCRFNECRFDDCDFSSCSIDSCSIEGAKINSCTFEFVTVRDTYFVESIFIDTDFESAKFDRTSFENSSMNKINFKNASASSTNFASTKLVNTDISTVAKSGSGNVISTDHV